MIREFHDVFQRLRKGQRTARADARRRQLGVAVLDDHVVDAKLIFAVRQTCRHDAVRNGDDAVPALTLEQHAHRARMQMASVAYRFAPAVALQRRAHDGGLMLMEQAHRVECVRDAARAAADGFHTRLVIRAGMPDGDDDVLADFSNHVNNAGHLRRYGDVANHTRELILVIAQEVFVSFAEQVFGHCALIFLREERSFQVCAQKLSALSTVAHDVLYRAETLFGRFGRIGQHAGVERGHALRRKERGNLTQTRFIRGVDIDACRAMGMDVDESGGKAHAARVDDLCVVIGQVLANLCDKCILAKHIGADKPSIPIHARILNQELIHKNSFRGWGNVEGSALKLPAGN